MVTGLVGRYRGWNADRRADGDHGDATDNGISITTGSAATSITDNFNTDTVTVNATALAQNTALTLVGRRPRRSPDWSGISRLVR